MRKLSYLDPDNCVVSVLSVALRETTLTVSVWTGVPVSMEPEIVRVLPIVKWKYQRNRNKKSDLEGLHTLRHDLQASVIQTGALLRKCKLFCNLETTNNSTKFF